MTLLGARLFADDAPPLTDEQRARVLALAAAIAERVADDAELIMSPYGLGLSVLVDSMTGKPDDTYNDLRPILRFLGQGLDYAEHGVVGADLAAFLPDL